jgi:uncharacterized protein YecE (DUF72 family)
MSPIPDNFLLGTSAFTAAGWSGNFYPEGLKQEDYLTFYAQRFKTVEIDSTFYGTPKVSTTRNWYERTPAGFVFALKVPQIITHERCMVGCDVEMKDFITSVSELGDKLGPMLFQFPYYRMGTFPGGVKGFLDRLDPFLRSLPRGFQYAVEIRNKAWLSKRLTDILSRAGAALVLIDHPWMARPAEIFARIDPVTASFTYVRWLGDRHLIERTTVSWGRAIVDRRTELEEWARVLKDLTRRGISVYAYANNHFAGHGPDTLRLFRSIWDEL